MESVRTQDGIEIPYVVDGDGNGPRMIFAHGLSGQGVQTREGVAPLVDAGWTVASFDQRGHADASPVTDLALFDPVAMGTDLWMVADAIGWDTCWIGGGSMGAATSFRSAVLDPERVEGLVQGCPALHDKPHEAVWLFDAMADILRDRGMDGLIETQRQFIEQMGGNAETLERVDELRAHDAKSLETAFRAVPRWVMADYPSGLAAFSFPIIVIGWDGDIIHPLPTAEGAAAAAGVELVRLEFNDIQNDRALLGRVLAERLPALV